MILLLLKAISLYQTNLLLLVHSMRMYYRLLRELIGFSGPQLRAKFIRKGRKRRKFWVRPGRSSLWWDNLRTGVTVDEEWKENFRLSKSSFFKLCDELRPHIEKQTTVMRSSISVEKQVGITCRMRVG